MSKMESIGIGEFRQRATEIIKQVEETAQPVTISRRGEPVVEIRALEKKADDLVGSVELAGDVDLTDPALEPGEWLANT